MSKRIDALSLSLNQLVERVVMEKAANAQTKQLLYTIEGLATVIRDWAIRTRQVHCEREAKEAPKNKRVKRDTSTQVHSLGEQGSGGGDAVGDSR